MSEMTLRIIEGLVLYDLFKIFINLTLRLALGVLNKEIQMPNSKELELERQALLLDMAGKIDFIYSILSKPVYLK